MGVGWGGVFAGQGRRHFGCDVGVSILGEGCEGAEGLCLLRLATGARVRDCGIRRRYGCSAAVASCRSFLSEGKSFRARLRVSEALAVLPDRR